SFGAAYDKLMRAADGLELSRDLVAGVRDYNQAKIANDQNDIMKRLAIIATIFLPISWLTGFFGQNFGYLTGTIEPPQWAFWVLGIGLELVAVIAIFYYFRRQRWL